MKRLLTLSLSILTALMAFATEEKTDVTSTYVKNASFEADNITSLQTKTEQADGLRGYIVSAPKDWTVNNNADVVSLIVTADCYTDNNFGKVTTLANGTQAYYLRMGWSTGTTTIRQTVTLPKGKYQLSAGIRSAYANAATSSFELIAGSNSTSGAFEQGSQGCFTSMKWGVQTVNFEMAAEGSIDLGINVTWLSGGSCIMFDDIRLYALPDDYIEPVEPEPASPTEGTVLGDFIAESDMKSDLLQMLANFATYLKDDFQNCAAPNSQNEACGCFIGENTMANDEKGVRPNADLSMICAFLVKYGKGKVTLPANVTWDDIETLAMKSLVFAYSTHKANKLKVCAGNNYWGSTGTSDAVWESSLWAMSVAYSAFFQWDKLSDTQKNYIYKLLKAECNYELNRTIPTGYAGDTKAEENGWEADILAATLGLFPNDELAPKWFARLREFAINSYSQKDDATNNTIIDPDYDTKTVKDLYKGQNLYDDYTLQNHNYFHTSYQNVVIQELGEAALALKLFQQGLHGEEKWKTNALMHNNDKVMEEVLYWLALADGELAMPNGNDWSLFLYDQITSYSTNACFLRDPHALMLENLAYKMIKARQATTTDGSWLLRADVGARRMGVEAHRVMMTWLMHEVLSTADLTPTTWDDFNHKYECAKVFPSQNIVRAATDSRFTCFSWSQGLKSYTGYIAANSVDKNKIIVPFRANNTGNFLGWYEVQGKGTNATPVVSGIYDLRGNSYIMNGELNTNDGTLNNRFAIYSTPGNAVIYIDYVRANADVTITKEKGGLMAISMDELTKTKRNIYFEGDCKLLDGSTFTKMNTNWVNISNDLSIVSMSDKQMAFGEKANNNSVMTAKLYASYSDKSRSIKAGDLVDRRNITYYSNSDISEAQGMAKAVTLLDTPQGWHGIIAADNDGYGADGATHYLLLSNFASDQKCALKDIKMKDIGAPVFHELTTIKESGAEATFSAEENHSAVSVIRYFIQGNGVEAIQDKNDDWVIYLRNTVKGANTIHVTCNAGDHGDNKDYTLTNKVVKVSLKVNADDGEGTLRFDEAAGFPESDEGNLTKGYKEITNETLVNASFEEDETYGKADGNATCDAGTFNPCYVNTVAAANSKWPNILPVKGWTAGNTLSGGSNFCRMYSMPYSMTQYCVSPKAVGNYAARCSRPISDENCGNRALTVLNSWDSGSNAISQNVTLRAGKYRLLMDARMECPNLTSNDGKIVTTSGNNTCTSLTGIKIGSTTDYRYPTENNTWQQLCYDFELTSEQTVMLSLGFKTSASAGAANNTLLYIDHLQLLRYDDSSTAINEAKTGTLQRHHQLFDLQGRHVNDTPLRHGIYIQNGHKVIR